MDEVHIEKFRSEAIFQHKFINVKQKLIKHEQLYSSVFYVHNLPWVINMDAKHNIETNEIDALSCYVFCNSNFNCFDLYNNLLFQRQIGQNRVFL